MKRKLMTLIAAIAVALLTNANAAKPEKGPESPASTPKGPVETFLQGCKTELETYCKDVTPGDNRLLACIYAHEDKLTTRCEYALYDASAQLERAVAALSYFAGECHDDLVKHCANVEIGEGRVLACLEKNEKEVSGRCKQALKDVGLKK